MTLLVNNFFFRAVAARTSAANNALPAVSSIAAASKPKTIGVKKDAKKSLKGVVVKKKAKPTPAEDVKSTGQNKAKSDDTQPTTSRDNAGPPDAKRRRLDS